MNFDDLFDGEELIKPGPPPAYHVPDEDFSCSYGSYFAGDPNPLPCDCEDPANPWPPRLATDGPRDCNCAMCSGKPRPERGRGDCEYVNHHCDNCHEGKICTTDECRAMFR